MATKKRTFVNSGSGMQEQVAPVATPTPTANAALAPATTPAPEKKDVLTKEAFDYRNSVWAKLQGAKLATVRALTSLAAVCAKFGAENIPIGLEAFKTFMDAAVEVADAPKTAKVPQFTQEAWGLVRSLGDELLSHIRAGVFNGVTGVTLEAVLLALYLGNQEKDEKKGELELGADGGPVVLTCGCGVCNGRHFLQETWEAKNGRVGNYVPGSLLGSSEAFVPVSRKCIGRINAAVYKANEPVVADNAKIAERRRTGERTEPFKAIKPLVYGLSACEAAKVVGGEQRRQERRQQSDNRLAEIVDGLHAPTKTGGGRGNASAYPQTRRGHRGDESRF